MYHAFNHFRYCSQLYLGGSKDDLFFFFVWNHGSICHPGRCVAGWAAGLPAGCAANSASLTREDSEDALLLQNEEEPLLRA